jgi:hypothetical protein
MRCARARVISLGRQRIGRAQFHSSRPSREVRATTSAGPDPHAFGLTIAELDERSIEAIHRSSLRSHFIELARKLAQALGRLIREPPLGVFIAFWLLPPRAVRRGKEKS